MKIKKFLKDLGSRCIKTVKTFPASLAVITLAFGIMTYLTWIGHNESTKDIRDITDSLVPTLWIVLPLFTSIHLFKLRKWLFLFVIAIGVVLYIMLHGAAGDKEFALQVGLWGGAFYLTLFALPKWKNANNLGFWYYTGHMVFILCLALISTLILSGSLSLALLSIENLFDINVDSRLYETVLNASYFLFLPIFAHVWLPNNWKTLNEAKISQNFLRPFSYYLLLPIFFLYLMILSTYVLKIIFTGVWPSGEVAYPILFFSILFFGFYFISYPWKKAWNKFGFIIVAPFLIVYFFALYQRIDQYGITEFRYLGVLLGAVLFFSSLYFFFSRKKRFQTFVALIAGTAFLSIIGPWSIFNVSIWDQTNRLENLLIEHELLINGKLIAADEGEISLELENEISQNLMFLINHDANDKIGEWTSLDPDEYDSLNGDIFMQEIGLNFEPWGIRNMKSSNNFYYQTEDNLPILIGEYDLLFESGVYFDTYNDHISDISPLDSFFTWGEPEEDEHEMNLFIDEFGVLSINYDQTKTIKIDVLELQKFSEENNFNQIVDPEFFHLEGENEAISIYFALNNLSGRFEDNGELDSLTAYGLILVKLKKQKNEKLYTLITSSP